MVREPDLYSRRKFLASARLVGTAACTGSFLPDAVAALRGENQAVVISTHEWLGDIEERLDFPGDWEINVMNMAGHHAALLSPAEIRRAVQKPLGSRPLREIAAGKKTAVVTFDDLSRPTPAYQVAPFVVEELKAAGLTDENIVFLTSYGSHRSMEQDEVARKLGRELTSRFAWLNHNVFDSLRDVGETSRKNRIKLNRTFVAAEVKVTISGIKGHGLAGYGGGAKAILPGIAGIDTIKYNHLTIGENNKAVALGNIFRNEVRRDMEEAARLGRADFGVQIVYNGKRQACRVFAGDLVEAHLAACRMANQHYRTKVLQNADVVVANAYPETYIATGGLGWIDRSVREGGTGVLIMQHPQAMFVWNYFHQPGYAGGRDYWERAAQRTRTRRNWQLVVYCQYLQKQQMNKFPDGTLFASSWNDVMNRLLARHKSGGRVAVYPYSPIQHGEIGLGEP